MRPRGVPDRAVGASRGAQGWNGGFHLNAFGSPSPGSWGGYWGKQGPELLDHRLALEYGFLAYEPPGRVNSPAP
jgi:hypothetical protein